MPLGIKIGAMGTSRSALLKPKKNAAPHGLK
jgi:hypothetical protein